MIFLSIIWLILFGVFCICCVCLFLLLLFFTMGSTVYFLIFFLDVVFFLKCLFFDGDDCLLVVYCVSRVCGELGSFFIVVVFFIMMRRSTIFYIFLYAMLFRSLNGSHCWTSGVSDHLN